MATIARDGVEFEDHPAVMTAAWHNLCVGVMTQAVMRLAAERNLWNAKHYSRELGGGFSKERIHEKVQARGWIQGGTGRITYEECCEELGVDPARARKKILEWAESKKRARLPMPSYYGGDDGEEG